MGGAPEYWWPCRPRRRPNCFQICCLGSAPYGPLIEYLAGVLEDRVAAGDLLPAPNGNIDIQGIDLDAEAAPADLVAGEQCRAAAQERIQHRIAALRGIKDGVGEHADGLRRRVERKLIALAAKARHAAGGPQIGSGSTVLAELDVIHVRLVAELEDGAEFVLAAVERSHAGGRLGPDA